MLTTICWLAMALPASAQQAAHLSASMTPDSAFVLAIDPAFHVRYGCLYPITYRFQLAPGASGLVVERRRSCSAPWDTLPEKTPDDYFNGIEAVRFDYAGELAHVSASFAADSDSLYLRFLDPTGTPTNLVCRGMDHFYDDRRAAVTVSADDWCDDRNASFCATLDVFRSYGLYVTCGVITGPGWCADSTWASIESEVDSGYVEVASHSRTHVDVPYADAQGEVEGSADDIVNHLHLPALFASGGRQYVYVWLAPYGAYDDTVDSLVGDRAYLVPRLYNHLGQWYLSSWDRRDGHFPPIQATTEIGVPPWGGGSTSSSRLNQRFDDAVSSGGAYHLMWHPQGLYPELGKPYVADHLRHISGRHDLWYTNLGHLYLYHLIEEANPDLWLVSAPLVNGQDPSVVHLHQNYPNPFNPRTSIGFDLPGRARVSVRIFDALGRQVATLVDGPEEPGRHVVSWDARKARSGTYFCRMKASPLAGGGTITSTRKLLLVR